jgi:hypothetical protein
MDKDEVPESIPHTGSSGVKITSNRKKTVFANVDFSRVQHSLRFYTNHIGTSSTLFDIRVQFSDIDPSPDASSGTLYAVGTLTVLMSPEIAEILHKSLGKILDNYTHDYGKSRIPEGAITFGKDIVFGGDVTPPADS